MLRVSSSPAGLLDPSVVRQWAASVRGLVILPGDSVYDDARRVWNRAIDRRPSAIVRCADADDVRRAIDLASTTGVPLAVRSGGHSQAGFGVCDGGIVLDLGAMRAVTVDVERRSVRVASGARVADVMDATQARGLVTPMGGCTDVGVGGLTVGGGENFLMARFGAVCDNLLSAEIATADGGLLTASASENEDLFWAIRGGGGNFGVATTFEYRLHEVGDVLSGQLMFPLSRAADVMRRYRDLMETVEDDFETSGGLTPSADGPTFFIAVCHSGDGPSGERAIERWRSALRPDSDTVKWSPYSADLVVPAAPSIGTGRFLCELGDDAIERFAEAMNSAPAGASAVWNDLHGAVTRVPQEAMAFPQRRRGYDLHISVPWKDDRSRIVAERWVSALSESLRPFAQGVYVNNLNQHEADRVAEAYGANYARLRQVKAKYDPGNFFRVNHNVPPVA